MTTRDGGRAARDAAPPSRHLRAIVDAIAPAAAPGLSDAERREVLDATTAYVAGQVAAMSRDLRAKAWAGIAGFRTYALLRRGRPFARLPLDQRQRLVEAWSYGDLYLPRQLFRMLRSLTLLAWFEHPLVVGALTGAPRNATQRATQRVSLPDPGRP